MSQMEENGSSILHKFVTIQFNKEDRSKSKSQAVKDYPNDFLQNEAVYESAPTYVSGIFSCEKDWPLLYSLLTERIEKERMAIPTAAFQFWEQRVFKTLLFETMDKSVLCNFKPKEAFNQGIICSWKC